VVQLTGGNVTLNGLTGTLALNGPTLVGQSTVNGTLNFLSGGIRNGSALTVASSGVLNIEGAIVVQGALTNAGTVNWQGAT
jgi:hypothetical protein